MAADYANSSPEFRKAIESLRDADDESFLNLLSTHPGIAEESGDYRLTLLHEAASQDRITAVRALLDAGVSPNIRGNDDATPLHWAASLGHLDIVKTLVEAGGDLTLSDGLGEGGTPLVQALLYGHAETAAWIAERCRNPDNLRVAAGLGDLNSLKRLLGTPEAGACRAWYRPHTEFPDGTISDDPQEILDEAFIYACANGQIEAARWLLDHGADVNGKPWYAPALFFAHWQKREDVVHWLVEEAGADLSIRDDQYKAYPWHWAHYTGQPELAVWLANQSDLWESQVFLQEHPEG